VEWMVKAELRHGIKGANLKGALGCARSPAMKFGLGLAQGRGQAKGQGLRSGKK